ncbi:iqgap- protein, partial [Coemansia guatemalensis]
MDSNRPRASTLGIDSSTTQSTGSHGAPSFQRVRKVSGGGHVYEDMDSEYIQRPHSKTAAISTTSDYTIGSAMAVPRGRSRTVADNADARPRSSLMHANYSSNMSALTGRPLSSLMVDPPDSPSVMGLKGRHRLQREASVSYAGGDSTGSSTVTTPGGGGNMSAGALAAQFMRNGIWCDVERQNLAAYEYLCHVSEAKEWIEACIGESLPEISEIEDSLRDGVAMAKLARTFCPEAVGKIYQQSAPVKLTAGVRRRFVFKYTDNINFFLSAIRQVRLPRLFHFELTDLYDRKNMPRVIYCLHALSHFLLKMGIAPEMKDLVGHLEFTDAQLAQTQAELDNLGANMPSFHMIDSSIGSRRPRLSREVCPMQFEDMAEEDEASDDDEDIQNEGPAETEEAMESNGTAKKRTVSFNEDVSYLDDVNLDRMEKAKRYWQRRIDIVVQYQCSARQRLAERILEEKRQARRYLRMVESATVMQSMARMVLARRQLLEYRAEVQKAEEEAELERQRQICAAEEAEEELLRKKQRDEEEEEERMERAMRERARKEREARRQAEREAAERAEQELQERLEEERSELERRIVGVQALVRGRLARKVYEEMRGWTTAIVQFQAVCRGALVRREVGDRLTTWGRIDAGVRQVQALARGYLVRQRIRDHRTHLKRNINVIVKMQNMYRAKLAGKAYRTLTVEDTPPTPKLVQSCAPLLEDTDQDLEEELELERLRQKAVRQIRENQQTGRVLDQLDIKIALLVRNRISLEEVLRQTRRHFRFLDEVRRPAAPGLVRGMYPPMPLVSSGAGSPPSSSLYSLRNMDKESRRKLESYQHLFYLLQTQPVYLARLLFLLNQGGSKAMRQSMLAASSASMANNRQQQPQGRGNGANGSNNNARSGSESLPSEDISISKLIETIVLTLFGFAQNAREEYLLLKLFCAAIQIELSSIETLQEFLRGNPIFIKLAV